MKYFQVDKMTLRGQTITYMAVDRGGDGEASVKDNRETEILVGFSVVEYNEDGQESNTRFYPVKTNMEHFDENDADEVLAQIEADHDPSEWQNHDW